MLAEEGRVMPNEEEKRKSGCVFFCHDPFGVCRRSTLEVSVLSLF